ncbi:transmembrane protein 138 isoform X2 [Coregonus clupeaformis]|uniref:transmembrane protein 138 isoform X2 n=1 Tax=Coregonus clupeaformis TaxID=59861 RepID=UPI001BDFC722|nr:transmembrane protein 138 isoform X2 [Coregonus clupeaformis]
MLQTNNYSLVLLVQLCLLTYDLFINSFSELLRASPVIQLVLFIIQDIATLFNVIIILLMMFNTYVFQVGLVALLLNLRWLESNSFTWTNGLQVLFVFQRVAAVFVLLLLQTDDRVSVRPAAV